MIHIAVVLIETLNAQRQHFKKQPHSEWLINVVSRNSAETLLAASAALRDKPARLPTILR